MDVDRKTIDGFTTREICEQAGLNQYQVQQLRKLNLLSPVKQANAQFLYRFSDLVTATDIGKLIAAGTNFAKVVEAYSRVCQTHGTQCDRVSAIKFVKNEGLIGGDLLVYSKHGLLDPITGERAFDFHGILRPKRVGQLHTFDSLCVAQRIHADTEVADDWYQYALDCEDEENDIEAKRAYEKCIAYDEDNTDAWVNLGRLHFLSGRQLDSRYCYERALAVDESHQIGNYNLGILFELFESTDLAIEYLQKADGILESFQCLSRIYKKLGDTKRADQYMAKYFELSIHDDS